MEKAITESATIAEIVLQLLPHRWQADLRDAVLYRGRNRDFLLSPQSDPIRFKQDLRVTIQALGWRDWPPNFEKGPRYLPLQDDIASTVYWYQTEPHAKYPTLPDVNDLDVN